MKPLFLYVLSAVFFASSASATEWNILGARAMGMGGTGVALAQGPVGAYWNPAGLGQIENPSGFQLPIGANLEITGTFLAGANDFKKISDDCQSLGANNGLCQQANINAALAKMNHAENGLRANIGAGLDVKVKRLTVFFNQFMHIGAMPRTDLVNITPANVSADLNNSKLILRGLAVSELGVGYGRELPFAPGVLVGGNLKALIGKAGYGEVLLSDNAAGSSGSSSNFKDNMRTSVQPGLDLGVLWDMNRTFASVPLRPRLGLTARNINNPKFKNPDAAKNAGERDKYSLQGNTRLGLAISPFHFWHIAFDADLSRNLTPVDGVASQMIGLGTEVNVFNRTWINIPLRAGLSRNMALPGSKTALSAGFGLHFLHVHADLSAMLSPATQTIQSESEEKKIPASIGLAAQLGVLFGGEKE